ncbi:phiSA1p31-related protein [Streptomyces sp. NRRL F-5630]|uniref:phiSA1p31-related protein n=1 Tax=Streptomyces sp. NRRL F-5630 TaxID=1463864 RepID=UPI003D71D928
MTHRIKLVDLDEHSLVVTIDADGVAELHSAGMCKMRAAAILRFVSTQLAAEHGLGPCHPEPEPQHERAEPLIAHAGSLDRERRLWTDGTGHAWDLSLAWAGVDDRAWRWHGSLDRQGTPIMRSSDGAASEPLDVVRAVWGPLAPVNGDEA